MRLSRQTSGRVIALFAVGIVGLGLSGCCGEPEADLAAPLSYDNAGIAFDYPGNWKISDDGTEPQNRYVMVETPGEAITIVTLVPAEEAADLDGYSRVFSDEARKNTPVGDVSASTFSKVTGAEDKQAQTENFTISLAGESLPHTRHYRRVASDKSVCFVLAQAADEDMDKAKPGFDLIFSTLKCTEP